ncbi:MAG: helix-turn-helix domain-containing protein [Chloroflexi bacterium]|nr:helix-turn-helix domain-containing protein [Chloroflexota bacterium]
MAIQREYLSPNEIGEYLGVSPFTIRRYIKLGELKAVKLLGGFRVHRNELQAFLKAHEVNPAEEQLDPEEVSEEPPVVRASALPAPPPAPIPTTTVPAIQIPQNPPRRPRGRPRKNPLPV